MIVASSVKYPVKSALNNVLPSLMGKRVFNEKIWLFVLKFNVEV